jgi:hypothetical protein
VHRLDAAHLYRLVLEKVAAGGAYAATDEDVAFSCPSPVPIKSSRRRSNLRFPAMYFRREFALAGGLMSFGTNTDENFQVMGEYTGRILKGEKLAICLFNNRPLSSS